MSQAQALAVLARPKPDGQGVKSAWIVHFGGGITPTGDAPAQPGAFRMVVPAF